MTKIAETLESAKDKCLLLVCFPPYPTTSLLTSVVAFGQTAQNVNKKIEHCESSLFFKTTIRTFLREIEKVSDEDIDSVLSDKNQDEVLEKHCQYLGST